MGLRQPGLVTVLFTAACLLTGWVAGEVDKGSADGMRTVLDVPYASVPGADLALTSLDVYAPNGAKRAPVLVYVHGGGWRRGDKRNVGMKAKAFVEAGFVFVSINYRLSPDVVHPTHVEDVSKAIAWVNQHIGSYGGDPERIFLMGHSAGAHLVSLVAVDETYLKEHKKSLRVLRGVVSLDTAAYDVPTQVSYAGNRWPRRIYEQAFTNNRAVQESASPIQYVAAEKGIPAFLLVHAGLRAASRERAKSFAEELRKAGVEVELLAAPDKNHLTLNRALGVPGDNVTAEILRFLERHASDKGSGHHS